MEARFSPSASTVTSTLQDNPDRRQFEIVGRQSASSPKIPPIPRRIHIIGTGSIGKLVAHALRGIPDPPDITLIFHRMRLVDAWEKSKKFITLQDGTYETKRDGYSIELANEVPRQHGIETRGSDVYKISDETGVRPHEVASILKEQQEKAPYTPFATTDRQSRPGDRYVSHETIHHLLVTTKTIRTIPALAAIKHRLTRDSTICFLQNGMGIIDDVNKEIFPDEATRPNYIQGIITHGANVPHEKTEQDPFFVVHAGHGTIALGLIPREPFNRSRPPTPTGFGTDNPGNLDDKHTWQWASSANFILRTLTRCPVLCAVGFTPIELLQLQLEKLAVNSVLNPLTSMLDNRNGALLYNFALTRTMRLMLAETSLIIRSLPELRGIPNVPNRFSAERLETLVVGVSQKTQDNISSMLADIRAGRSTEIDYINGYIVRRGEEMGIKAVVNYAIMQLVHGKQTMVEREMRENVPIAGRTEGINRE